jgi:hypothetical protein
MTGQLGARWPWIATLAVVLSLAACIEKTEPTIVAGDADVGAESAGGDTQVGQDVPGDGQITDVGGDQADGQAEAITPDGAEDTEPELPEHCLQATCGDEQCDEDCGEATAGEGFCEADCCSCGDGVCNPACGEDGAEACAEDCCVCGDGTCQWLDWCGETGDTCWSDCCEPKGVVCGDQVCDWSCREDEYGTPTWCYDDCCVIGDSVCANGITGPQCGETGMTAFSDCCICGDGVCKGTSEGCDESLETCPNDCGACGDTACVGLEDYGTCHVDCCGGCGDGTCRGGECGETPEGCPEDCGVYACGNGECNPGEDPDLCQVDCKRNACGNRVCENGEDLNGETPCPADCAASCGDCMCEQDEDKLTCPIDCGVCGDGYYTTCMQDGVSKETPENCPQDFCDDHDPCTDEAWTIQGGLVACAHTPNSAACDDGNACTVGDQCAEGACQPGGDEPDCDDDNPCTLDSCDVIAGACVHDFDAQGVCPDDGNVCTVAACDDASQACLAANADGVVCDDEDPCTLVDECAGGVCAGHGDKECDDGNDCTNDLCVTGQGCFGQDKDDGVDCDKDCGGAQATCQGGSCSCP